MLQQLPHEAQRMGKLALASWLLIIASSEWLLTGSLILCTQTNSALTTTGAALEWGDCGYETALGRALMRVLDCLRRCTVEEKGLL